MIRKSLALGFALAAFGLSACDQQDRSPDQPGNQGGKGSARIALPQVPPGYLPDSGQKALFALTVSGPGLESPLMRTWALSPDHQEPVVWEDIPAGARLFRGRLIRMAAGAGDTTGVVTHEGTDSAFIQAGATTEVRLFLHQGGSGTAHVCVEVEGWPSDPTCIAPPDSALPPIAGCWSLRVRGAYGGDSAVTAKLRIAGDDSLVWGAVDWGGGRVDSARGHRYPDGTAYFGEGGGAFVFKARSDSAGLLDGFFADSARGLSGPATAVRVACDTAAPPDTSPTAEHACFAFTQSAKGGKALNGRLGVEAHSEGWAGVYTHWDGFAPAATDAKRFTGSLSDTARIRYTFAARAGQFPGIAAGDSLQADLTLLAAGTSSGTVRGGKPDRSLGAWKGQRTECRADDFTW